MKPRKILVPVDTSTPSKNAAVYASGLALKYGSQVFLLHVHPLISQRIAGKGLDSIRQRLDDDSALILQEYIKEMKKCHITPTTLIKSGDAGKEIVKAAKMFDCDLIVMGALGQNSIKGALLGSTVAKVLQGAECPVLVTKNLRKHYPTLACFD